MSAHECLQLQTAKEHILKETKTNRGEIRVNIVIEDTHQFQGKSFNSDATLMIGCAHVQSELCREDLVEPHIMS